MHFAINQTFFIYLPELSANALLVLWMFLKMTPWVVMIPNLLTFLCTWYSKNMLMVTFLLAGKQFIFCKKGVNNHMLCLTIYDRS